MISRQPASINSEGTLTVKLGPKNEVWTLERRTELFSASKEWNRIKHSIYVVPNVELRSSKEFEPYDNLQDLEQKMRYKYQDKTNKVRICFCFK